LNIPVTAKRHRQGKTHEWAQTRKRKPAFYAFGVGAPRDSSPAGAVVPKIGHDQAGSEPESDQRPQYRLDTR
jgi:hypothetical protein